MDHRVRRCAPRTMGRALAAIAALACCSAAAAAGGTPAAVADFTSLDIEQLMAVQVTGVTRRAESYSSSPAAIFVLTGEDLRRAGARSIVEALRLVPGVFVARSNAQSYSVSIRGFATSNSDKLQVMLDGRSVYSPLASAVFWDVLDTYLDDIERIEVIRGPGATVWGANAVNGVINIVTKRAVETQGTQGYVGGGNEEKAFAGVRSGGRLGNWGNGRVYAKAWERDASRLATGDDAPDGQKHVQAGARIGGAIGRWGYLRLHGDLYDGRQHTATGTSQVSGRDVVAAWDYRWRDGGETRSQLYYDGYDRDIPTVFAESRDTYDLSLQHNLRPRGGHQLTFGAGVRVSQDRTGGPPLLIIFQPDERTIRTYSAFAQDEIRLGERGTLVLGSKFEHNDFSGYEVQPGARLGWTLSPRFFGWAAVSRAVRTPNRLHHDIGVNCTSALIQNPTPGNPCAGLAPDTVISVGNRNFDSETLLAYEAGLRSQWSRRLLLDLALFYNEYDELRSTEPGLRFDNGLEGEGYGGELTVSWQRSERLAVQAFYDYLQLEVDRKAGSADLRTPASLEGSSPEHQAGLRVSLRPHPRLDLDAALRYVDELSAQDVDDYVELGLRAGWRLQPHLELSLSGQNLLDSRHAEFGTNPATRGESERSLFAELSWSWE